ncbi:hypothetical protein [Enterococcus sp. RIT-PI-f]|uniref:hypothetical protein n=1 Tax=Enterococcus sp. RIT-PI-f TaxID=1690244 RepID=UPI003564121D
MKIILIFFLIIFISVICFVVLYRNKNRIDNDNPKKYLHAHDVKTQNNYTDLKSATELILQNSLGEEMSFKRPSFESTKIKEYKEVQFTDVNNVVGKLVNTSMPFLQQSYTMQQLHQAAPNGIFTTTADIKTLSRFSDGSISTMVRNSSNDLVKHQGFFQITNVVKTNPIVAVAASMQVMALVSSQYYLNQINSQLANISERINELLNYHHDEKIGMLLTVKDRLSKIVSKQHADSHDIGEVRILLKDAKNVYEEYRMRLSRQLEELEKFEAKAFFEKDKIFELETKIQETNFTIKIVYEADQLSMQAELAEIAVRMKTSEDNLVIKELTEQIKDRFNSSFYHTAESFIKDKYLPIIREKYRKFGKNYLFKHPERLKQINHLAKVPELKSMDTKISDLVQQLSVESNREQEIVYLPSENLQAQRVFLAIN